MESEKEKKDEDLNSDKKKERDFVLDEIDYYPDTAYTGAFPTVMCGVTLIVIFLYAAVRYFFG